VGDRFDERGGGEAMSCWRPVSVLRKVQRSPIGLRPTRFQKIDDRDAAGRAERTEAVGERRVGECPVVPGEVVRLEEGPRRVRHLVRGGDERDHGAGAGRAGGAVDEAEHARRLRPRVIVARRQQDGVDEQLGLDESADPTPTISARAARGAAWLGASFATAQLISFVTTIVLARLLRPADFGVVAMANLMLAFVGPLHDSGLAAAFVARRERVRECAATLAWTTPVTGALAWAAVVVVAPLVGRLFGDPAVVPVVRVLGATFLLRGLAAAPMAVITKELAFGARSFAVTSGALVEAVVGIGLALAGVGLWSLVAGQVAGAGVTAATAWTYAPWRPWGHFSRVRLREMGRFGRHMVAGNVLGFVGSYLDNIVVGRLLGATALGLYGTAFRWGRLPSMALGATVNPVAFPSYVAVRADGDRLARAYLRVVRTVSSVAVPAALGLAMAAPALVGALYPAEWQPMVAPLRIFALFGLVNAIVATTGEVFKATDQPGWIPGLAAVHLPVLALGLWLLAGRGPGGAAAALTLAALVSGAVAVPAALRAIGLPIRRLASALVPQAAAGAVMVGAMALVARGLDGSAPIVVLGGLTVGGAVAYVAALAAFDRVLIQDVARTVGAAIGRVPAVPEVS
jgi:PST family polysaccharide transporter